MSQPFNTFENLCERIDARCKAVDKTVTSVLREARVDWSNYSRWRSGETSPTMKVLQRIDAVLKKYEPQQEEAAVKNTA